MEIVVGPVVLAALIAVFAVLGRRYSAFRSPDVGGGIGSVPRGDLGPSPRERLRSADRDDRE